MQQPRIAEAQPPDICRIASFFRKAVTMDADRQYQVAPGLETWLSAEVATEIWDRYLSRLEAERHRVGVEATEVGMRRSLLAAALNTGAIEGLHRAGRGLTVTVMEYVADWQRHVRSVEGVVAERHVAAALEALDMALDLANHRVPRVSEAWLRELHSVACSAQDSVIVHVKIGDDFITQEHEFFRGVYKREPNHVRLPDGSVQAYCPVETVADEMSRLVDRLDDNQFLAAHPVVQAAFAHHALVHIHPFQDGNGRVARALSSVYLFRDASIPLLVYEDQKVDYFSALASADRGDVNPLLRFVQDRGLDLLALAADLLRAGDDEDAPLAVVHPLSSVPPDAIEAAHRLRDVVTRELEEALSAVEVGEGVERRFSKMGFTVGAEDPEGRRTIHDDFPYVQLLAPKYGVSPGRWLAVYVSEDDVLPFGLSVRIDGGNDSADFRVRDVYPELRSVVEHRVRVFARRVVREVAEEAQSALARH